MNKSKRLQCGLEEVIGKADSDGFDGVLKTTVYDIPTGSFASVRGDELGWAASIIKVPVLVAGMKDVDDGIMKFDNKLPVDHKFTLEPADHISTVQEGIMLDIPTLMYHMIVYSDNEATNMLVDKIGIERVNHFMWSLGMKNSMFGHLLCPNVPRYVSDFNPDGSNVTTTNDMMELFRHMYDSDYSGLAQRVRKYSDIIMSKTECKVPSKWYGENSKLKSKIGFIHDPKDGVDSHEVGIIDDRTIVCFMANKVGQNIDYQEMNWEDFQVPVEDYSEFLEEYAGPLDAFGGWGANKGCYGGNLELSGCGNFIKKNFATSVYYDVLDVVGKIFGRST